MYSRWTATVENATVTNDPTPPKTSEDRRHNEPRGVHNTAKKNLWFFVFCYMTYYVFTYRLMRSESNNTAGSTFDRSTRGTVGAENLP